MSAGSLRQSIIHFSISHLGSQEMFCPILPNHQFNFRPPILDERVENVRLGGISHAPPSPVSRAGRFLSRETVYPRMMAL